MDLAPRTMPQSVEAEIAILGAIMLNPGEALDVSVEMLTPNHFYQRNHQIIFETLVEMCKRCDPIDSVTVTTRLKDANKLDEVGGAYYLSKLSMAFPTAAHIKFHIDVLRDKHKMRQLIETCITTIENAYDAPDAIEVVNEFEKKVFALSSDTNINENRLLPACAELEQQSAKRKRGEKIIGIKSSLAAIDNNFFGIQESQYYCIAGRPSMGKTALADQITLAIIMQDIPVLYIGLESSDVRVVGKLACKMAEVCYTDWVRGYCQEKDVIKVDRCIAILKTKPLIIIKPFDIRPVEIRSMMRRYNHRYGCKVLVFDYIQKLTPNGREEPRIVVGEASKQIQQGCLETNMSAIVLAQLNRDSEKEKRPRLSNIKECVTGGTEIFLEGNRARSIKRIFQLSSLSQLRVKTCRIADGSIDYIKPIEVLNLGLRKTIKVRLKSGKMIQVSPDTKFWNGLEWIPVKQLKIGVKIATDISVADKNIQKGVFSNSGRTRISNHSIPWNKGLTKETNAIVRSVGAQNSKRLKGTKICKPPNYSEIMRKVHPPQGTKCYDGYRYVYLPDWPSSYGHGNYLRGYVREHRYVMEKHIGRMLSKNERIHHLDGNPSNNDISNLKLCSCAKEHQSVHIKAQKFVDRLIREGKVIWDEKIQDFVLR